MTDQIADARPPTRAEQADRLRKQARGLRVEVATNPMEEESRERTLLFADADDAGAAALEEVATLRAAIDRLDCTRREGGDTRHCRLDAKCQRCELDALRARVQHLTEALEQRPSHTCHASSDTCAGCEFAIERNRRIQRLRDEADVYRQALEQIAVSEHRCPQEGDCIGMTPAEIVQPYGKIAADALRAALTPPASTEGK